MKTTSLLLASLSIALCARGAHAGEAKVKIGPNRGLLGLSMALSGEVQRRGAQPAGSIRMYKGLLEAREAFGNIHDKLSPEQRRFVEEQLDPALEGDAMAKLRPITMTHAKGERVAYGIQLSSRGTVIRLANRMGVSSMQVARDGKVAEMSTSSDKAREYKLTFRESTALTPKFIFGVEN